MSDQACDDWPGKVGFSREKKAGVGKVSHGESVVPREQEWMANLPAPPSSRAEGGRNCVNDIQIPLPPCAFQPPYYRTSSKKDHDPFLAAYKECTKNRKSSASESRLRKSMSIFSCKRSCSVRDNNLVRISHIPHNRDV